MKKIILCQVFTYPYSNPLWVTFSLNQLNAKHDKAQGLDSTGTNNLARLVAQCACVLYHKAHIRDLNWGTSASCSIADKMRSLHNSLRSCDINTVGKRKQLHGLTAGLVKVSSDTWTIRK